MEQEENINLEMRRKHVSALVAEQESRCVSLIRKTKPLAPWRFTFPLPQWGWRPMLVSERACRSASHRVGGPSYTNGRKEDRRWDGTRRYAEDGKGSGASGLRDWYLWGELLPQRVVFSKEEDRREVCSSSVSPRARQRTSGRGDRLHIQRMMRREVGGRSMKQSMLYGSECVPSHGHLPEWSRLPAWRVRRRSLSRNVRAVCREGLLYWSQ